MFAFEFTNIATGASCRTIFASKERWNQYTIDIRRLTSSALCYFVIISIGIDVATRAIFDLSNIIFHIKILF